MCAPGCPYDLLVNEQCDKECDVKACDYDNGVCECAPGCSHYSLGSCYAPCLVLNCNYDNYNEADGCTSEFTVSFSVFVGIAAHNYATIPNTSECSSTCYVSDLQAAYEQGTCLHECLSPQCAFSMGLCAPQLPPNCEIGWGPGRDQCFQCAYPYVQYFGTCIEACQRGLQAYTLFPRLCVAKPDISTLDTPDRMYVLEDNSQTAYNQGDLYFHLMDALAAAWAKYTVISLVGEKVAYRVNYMYSHLDNAEYSRHKAFPDLFTTASWSYLKIQSLPCAENSQKGCYEGATTLLIYPTAITIPQGKIVVFENVIFTTRHLFAATSYIYCPRLMKGPSDYINDRGEIVPNVRNGLFQCSNYASIILFQVNVGAELRLTNVKVADFTIQLRAFILLEGGKAFLSNVIFTNVQPGSGPGPQAVILSEKPCDLFTSCGSLTYQTGKVEYLNNGYELTEDIRLSPFLRVTALNAILIEGVVFQYNAILSGSDELGLLTIGSFLSFSMVNCGVDSSIFIARFLDIRTAISLPPDKKNDPVWSAQTHIRLSHVAIKRTFAGSHMIFILMTGTLLNIDISDCSFSESSVSAGHIVYIEFAGVLTDRMISGNNDPKKGPVLPANFAYIQRTSFTALPAYAYVICLTQLVNIRLQDIVFGNNIDLKGKGSDTTAKFYIDAVGTYAQLMPKDMSSARCQNMLFITNSVNSVGKNISISSNKCEGGGTGLAYSLSQGNHVLSDITVRDNTSGGDFGAGLSLLSTVTVSISNLQARSNTADTLGVICLGSGTSLTLENSLLQENAGYTGTGIYSDGVVSLVISSTVFKGNKALLSEGAAIFVFPSFYPAGILAIRGCTFEGNIANSGGAINIVFSTGGAPLDFSISDSIFTNNQVTTAGSSIAISAAVVLKDGSSVQKCTFKSEKSTLGALSLTQLSGHLLIKDSSFEDCSGDPIAVLSLQTGNKAVTTLESVTVKNSKGKAAIRKANSLLYSVLLTRKCLFLSNQITSIFFESGYWEDTESQFRLNANTAVVMRASAFSQLTNTVFDSNTSPNVSAAYHASESTLNCTGCVFRNNTAAYGSALVVEQSSSLTLRNCLFEGNKAVDYAPAIAAQGTINTPTYIYNTTFQRNDGPNGLIVLFNARMYLDSVLIQYNTASAGSPSITTLQSTLVGNNVTCRYQTGADAPFLTIQTGCTVTISNSRFYEGSAADSGAIEMSGSLLTVTQSTFFNLKGSLSALLYTQGVNTVVFDAVTAYNLVSDGEGSVVDTSYSKLTIIGSYFHDFEEGAVDGAGMVTVTIVRTRFERGSSSYGGGLLCSDCIHIAIDSSRFELLNATFGGAISISNCLNVTISNTVFQTNTAEIGGGLYAQDSVLHISDSAFYENWAFDTDGGGLYVDCPSMKNCAYELANTVFEGNTANRSGGALAWQQAKPALANVTTANNTAYYGPNFASFPTRLELRSSRLLQEELSDLPPGQSAGVAITAALVDHYNQIVITDNSSSASLEAVGSSASVSGASKATAVNGVFTFTEFSVYAEPLGNVTLSIVTTGIPASSQYDPTPHETVIALNVRMRDCLPGESATAESCNACENKTFSFDPVKPCQNCPANAQCLGTTQMYPNSGYWRSGVYAEKVWVCPKPSSCLGGDPFDNHSISWTGYCAEGYTRNMCQSCAWGYSRAGKDKCGLCPPLNINIVRIVFVVIAMVAYNVYQIWAALKTATMPTAVHSIYLKILTNYLQLVFLVTEFRLSWPQPVLELFSSQESSGGVTEQLYSIECFLSANGDASKVYFKKMIFMAVLPIGLIAGIVFFWGIMVLKTGKLEYLKQELAASLVIAFFFIHPTLTKALFSMFSCTEINNGEFWLTIDLAIPCYDSEHFLYLFTMGIPAIAVWVFAVPLLCLSILIRNRRNLDELWLRLQYGFLIGGFSRKRYYWEFVVTFRKIAVICCSVFFTNSIEIQALTVQALLLGFFLLQLTVRPYSLPELNSTELKAIAVADLTIYCGLYYLTDSLAVGSSWFFFVLIILANALFLLYWAIAFLGVMVDKMALAVPCLGLILRPQVFECDPYIEYFIANTTISPSNCLKLKALESPKALYLLLLQSDNLYSGVPLFEQPSYTPSMPGLDRLGDYSFSAAGSSLDICNSPISEEKNATNRSII